jgi:hypothetical protein
MAHSKPVDKSLAEECMDQYVKMYGSTNDPKLKEAYSASVTFNTAQLIAWLSTAGTDSVNISFGVYTKEYVATYPAAKLGRLTAFFVPIISGVPTPPPSAPGVTVKSLASDDDGSVGDDPDEVYNLGSLNP